MGLATHIFKYGTMLGKLGEHFFSSSSDNMTQGIKPHWEQVWVMLSIPDHVMTSVHVIYFTTRFWWPNLTPPFIQFQVTLKLSSWVFWRSCLPKVVQYLSNKVKLPHLSPVWFLLETKLAKNSSVQEPWTPGNQRKTLHIRPTSGGKLQQ